VTEGESRIKALSAAAKEAGADEAALGTIAAWDGGYLELNEGKDKCFTLILGETELIVPEDVFAKLGLLLDNALVEFEQDMPTAVNLVDREPKDPGSTK
jgi:hypothetical protein